MDITSYRFPLLIYLAPEIISRGQDAANYFIAPTLELLLESPVESIRAPSYPTGQILQAFSKIIILGAPGSGKTELLFHLGYMTAIEYQAHPNSPFPVLVDRPSLEQGELIGKIVETLGLKVRTSPTTQWNILLLIDGIDEISPQRKEPALREIAEFGDEFPGAKIVLTTRYIDSAIRSSLTGYTILAIQPFDQAQVMGFLQKQSPNWRGVQSQLSQSRALSDLISNPLLLSIFSKYSDVVLSPNQYFDPIAILDEMMQRELERLERRANIPVEIADRVLEQVSGHLQIRDSFEISGADFRAIAEGLIKESGIVVNGEVLMQEISRLFVFSEPKMDSFSFAHRTFYEYYLTKYLRRLLDAIHDDRVIDQAHDLLVGIRLHEIIDEITLARVLVILREVLPTSEGRIVPLYAIRGSLEVLFLVGGLMALAYPLKTFSEALFSRLGQATADRLIIRDDEITLPNELLEILPVWISDNANARREFARQLVVEYGRKSGQQLADNELMSKAIMALWRDRFGQYIEDVPVERFLRPVNEETTEQ